VEGSSLVPLWQPDGDGYDAEIAVSEMWRNHWHIVALRTLTHKYIWDSRQPEAPRLYDLLRDPNEQHNVVGQFADIEMRFKAALEAHLSRGEATSGQDAGAPPELDDALAQRLQDLGYVD
jgi:hypothetical protein